MEKLTYLNDQPDISVGDEEEHQAKNYTFRPLKEAFFVGMIILFSVISTTYFLYTHAIAAQKGEIQDGIIRSATILSNLVDGDQHVLFEAGQESTAAYRNAIEPLRVALESDPSITYVYTMIMRDEKVYFILDPTPPGDADEDGEEEKSYIMDPYPEANQYLIRAFKEKTSVREEEISTDRWGSFLSGYVPIYNSQGEMVAVLGVDISAKNYLARLAPIKRATVRAMVTGFFIAFVVASLVWFMRRFSKVVNQRRVKILQAYQDKCNTPDQEPLEEGV